MADGGPRGRPEKGEVPIPRFDTASKVTWTRISGDVAPGRERWKQTIPEDGRGPVFVAATTAGILSGSMSDSVGG